MPQDSDFKAWLKEHWSRRPDLHLTLKRFHQRGADLGYVSFVCQFFLSGDWVRREAGFNRRRGLLSVSLPAPRTPRNLNRLDLSDVLRMANRKTFARRLDLTQVEKFLVLREQVADGANSLLDSIGAECDANRLFLLFVQFSFPREFFNARGEPHDRWGSFFLLAIRDYLRTLRPYKTTDNERLAYELFRKLRGDARHIPEPKHDVLMRIKRLKDAHPNWRAALDVLTSEYRPAATVFRRPFGALAEAMVEAQPPKPRIR